MKRWTFRIVLCLLLGVVTTVGVAWGCVWQVQYYIFEPFDQLEDQTFDWWIQNSPWKIDSQVHTNTRQRVGVKYTSAFADRNPETIMGDRISAGWPNLALEGHTWSLFDIDELFDGLDTPGDSRIGRWMIPISRERMLTTPVSIADAKSNLDFLPLRPILPGFLINTLFYAVIWFALIFGGRAHMRMIRRWQGHCPMCKYDLLGDLDTGCPECGWNRENGTTDDG